MQVPVPLSGTCMDAFPFEGVSSLNLATLCCLHRVVFLGRFG